MHRSILLPIVTLLAACLASPPPPSPPPVHPAGAGDSAEVGILVMAHGGGPEWDRAVAEALAPVRVAAPTTVAFGMADAATLQAGLDSLTARGVRHVAVVRLFLSGQSFLAETRALLGLGEPVTGHHGRPLAAIDHDLQVATHQRGLLNSPVAVDVLVERAAEIGPSSGHVSLLLIAHGMGDDEEDAAVLRAMDEAVATLRPRGFARVERVTLREDWPQKRAEAEERIRSFVGEETQAGRSAVVVPVRLFGFGPYANVLEGLAYDSTPALLPHPLIARWILDTADEIACREGWPAITSPCPA